MATEEPKPLFTMRDLLLILSTVGGVYGVNTIAPAAAPHPVDDATAKLEKSVAKLEQITINLQNQINDFKVELRDMRSTMTRWENDRYQGGSR